MGQSDYDVVITARLRNDTAQGARETLSAVEKLAQEVSNTQSRSGDDYQRQVQRNVDQNMREWEREAQAKMRAAQDAEKARTDSIAREARATSKAVDDQLREQEQLANRLAIINAQRNAEHERFANQSALIAQKQRDKEVEAAKRASDEQARAAQQAAQQSALSFETIFGASFFANLGADMVRGLFSSLKEGIVETTLYAARTEELGIALDALSKANNLNSASVREQVTVLKEANIATQAAEQQVARFVATGLPLEKVSPLATVAKDLAVIAGLNSSDEFETLVRGITTLQTRVLRTAGVYIDVKAAQDEYAASIGKTREQLEPEEKQLAVLNKTIEFGARATGAYDAAMTSASKQMRSLTRVQQDFSDAIGSHFVPVLGLGVKVYGFLLQAFTHSPELFYAAAAGVTVFTIALIAMNTTQLASLPILGNIINSVRAMGQAMVGTISSVGLAAAGWAALVLVIGGIGFALYKWATAQKQVTETTKEHIDSVIKQRDLLSSQHQNLQTVADWTGNLDTRQQALTNSYEVLSAVEKRHVDDMKKEGATSQELAAEIQRIIDLKKQRATIELETISRTNVALLVGTLQEIDQNETLSKTLAEVNKRRQEAIDLLSHGGRLSEQQASGLNVSNAVDSTTQIRQLTEASARAEVEISNLSTATGKLNDEAVNGYVKQLNLNSALGQTTDEAIKQAFQFGLLSGDMQYAIAITVQFAAQQAALAGQTAQVSASIDEEISKINALSAAKRQDERSSYLRDERRKIAEQATSAADARRLDKERKATDEKYAGLVADEKRIKENTRALEEEDGIRHAARSRQKVSDLDKQIDRYHKLQFEVRSFSDLNTKAFDVRFKMEDLERVKKDYEEILNLRYAMQLPLREPLPAFNPSGTPEAQAGQLKAIQDAVEMAQREKRVFDGVTQAVDELAKAEETLVATREAAQLPVVGALTRAEIGYARSVRDSRNEIQELGAAVIVAERQRKDFESDWQNSVAKGYLQISRTFQDREKSAMEELRRQQALTRVLSGDTDALRSLVEGKLDLNVAKPPSELSQIAEHAANLDKTVAAIAVKIGAAPSPVSVSPEAQSGGYGRPLTADERARAARGEPIVISRASDSTVNESQDGPGEPPVMPQPGQDTVTDGDVEKVKVDTNALEGLIDKESVLRALRAEAQSARQQDENKVTTETWQAEATLHNQLVDWTKDLSRVYAIQAVQREKLERESALKIELLNKDVRDLDLGNAEALHRQQQRINEQRLSSRVSLRDDIAKVQNDIATNGEDSAKREELAYWNAARSIQQAHNQAAESIIADQVKIADQTVYHADIANARVMDYLASQKSVTDLVAEAKIGIIDATFSSMDRGFSKLTQHLGVVGSLIHDLAMGFMKLWLSPFFQALAGGGSRGSNTNGAGGGLLNAILGGGRTATTPPFAGGSIPGLSFNTTSGGMFSPGGGLNQFADLGFANSLGPGTSTLSQATSISSTLSTSQGLSSILHEAGHAGTTVGAATITSTLAGALPMLGLSAGASLGGLFTASRTASTIGTVAGGALGLSAGLAGFLALGGSLGTGTLAGIGGAIAGALPIIAPIAIAALVASYFINRSAQRRKDEETRTQLSGNVYNDTIKILNDTRAGNLTLSEATQQYNQVKQTYFAGVAQLKDSKTRRIATDWWNKDFNPFYWPLIEQAAKDAEKRKSDMNRMHPEFAAGGGTWTAFADGGTTSSFMRDSLKYTSLPDYYEGMVPGVYDRKDDKIVKVSGNEVILKPEDWMPIRKYLKVRQVKGFEGYADGNAAFDGSGGSSGGGLMNPQLEASVVIDENMLAEITINSPLFAKAVVARVKVAKKDKKL
jgi:hypothetical protein